MKQVQTDIFGFLGEKPTVYKSYNSKTPVSKLEQDEFLGYAWKYILKSEKEFLKGRKGTSWLYRDIHELLHLIDVAMEDQFIVTDDLEEEYILLEELVENLKNNYKAVKNNKDNSSYLSNYYKLKVELGYNLSSKGIIKTVL